MNPRFVMMMGIFAFIGLLVLVRRFMGTEGFRGQHGCQGGVRYGIAYHDRGGRVYGHGGW
jgi:hypothetical protein